jgi:hypothetical protein
MVLVLTEAEMRYHESVWEKSRRKSRWVRLREEGECWREVENRRGSEEK